MSLCFSCLVLENPSDHTPGLCGTHEWDWARVICFAGGQLTVRVWAPLVPPLEQPRLPELPEGVCTWTLKLPAAGIMEDVTLAVSWELLTTVVARGAPLMSITEEATKWPPVAVRGCGSCAKTIVVGVIELRLGEGRALPQRGFSALQPVRSKSATSHELRRANLLNRITSPRGTKSTSPILVAKFFQNTSPVRERLLGPHRERK